MKKIIIILSILLNISISQSFGQPPTGSTNFEPDMDKFIGSWKWADNGGNELFLKLKKVMHYVNSNGGYNIEVIYPCWKYTQNGIVIEDNLSLFPILGQPNISSPILSLLNSNALRGLLKDNILNKIERIRLTYNSSTNPPTLVWEVATRGGTYMPGIDPIPNNNTTLPKNLILIKQP